MGEGEGESAAVDLVRWCGIIEGGRGVSWFLTSISSLRDVFSRESELMRRCEPRAEVIVVNASSIIFYRPDTDQKCDYNDNNNKRVYIRLPKRIAIQSIIHIQQLPSAAPQVFKPPARKTTCENTAKCVIPKVPYLIHA